MCCGNNPTFIFKGILLNASEEVQKAIEIAVYSPLTPSLYLKVNSFGNVPFVISDLVKLVAEVI